MNKVGNKIRQRRMALGLRLQDVVDRIERLGGNIDQSSMSRIESGKQWPSEPTLEYILKALQCTFEELFLLTSTNGAISRATIGTRKLSLISDKEVSDYIKNNNFEADRWVFTERELSLRSFALNIEDDSMLPRFKKGDVVVIDPEREPEPGEFVVVVNGSNSYFRQYRIKGFTEDNQKIIDLYPLNEVYPVISSDTHDIQLVGTMVEHRLYDTK
jgi:SOS-response transcriptional repressor LexA